MSDKLTCTALLDLYPGMIKLATVHLMVCVFVTMHNKLSALISELASIIVCDVRHVEFLLSAEWR